MDIVVTCVRLKHHGRGSVGFIPQRPVRLANRPTECAAAHFSRDGKSKVRVAGMQFPGMKKFEKNGKEMLGGIFSG